MTPQQRLSEPLKRRVSKPAIGQHVTMGMNSVNQTSEAAPKRLAQSFPARTYCKTCFGSHAGWNLLE